MMVLGSRQFGGQLYGTSLVRNALEMDQTRVRLKTV
jgi:hypothetical protein